MKSLLTERLVRPALSRQWGVTAIRFSWAHDAFTNQRTWDQIARYRENLDQLVSQLPDCLYFISAIGATHGPSGVLWGYPVVGYWVVTVNPLSDCKMLFDHLNANQVLATPKMLLQPYQKTERDFNNVLFKIVKDNMHGCVPRLAQESFKRCYGSNDTEHLVEPAVRICMIDHSMEQYLLTTVSELQDLRFYTKLIHIKELVQQI